MNSLFIFRCLAIVFLLFIPSCSSHVSNTGDQKGNLDKERRIMSETSQTNAVDNWIRQCRNQLHYLSNFTKTVPALGWSSQKKESIVRLAVKRVLEMAPAWWVTIGENEDNGKLPVNIKVAQSTAPQNGYLLSDGEINTDVEWHRNGKTSNKKIRSWTGAKEGLETVLTEKDAVCLFGFGLRAWGVVDNKDVVVLEEDLNTGDGCLSFDDGNWTFEGWSSFGGEAVFSIIMWEEGGVWKSTVRSKKSEHFTLDEICQSLREEWDFSNPRPKNP